MTSLQYSIDEPSFIQAPASRPTWEGGSVSELTGTLAALFPQVPLFSRHPFRVGSEQNRFKDEIRREPLTLGAEVIPVAVVSKTYSLIQHRDVLSSVFRALQMVDIDISELQSSLILSEYGERMHWSCAIMHFDFDPGDKNPIVLRINCLNSVDTSTVLEITFDWFRLICSNGMMLRTQGSRLRRRHIQSLDPEQIAFHLREQLDQLPNEKSLYADWFSTPVNEKSLEDWIDNIVAKAWGPHAAARVWNIMRAGCDGEVDGRARDCSPHLLPVRGTKPVPGADAPVKNLYHVSQALSWIAGTRNSLTERLEYVKAVPSLIERIGNM